MQNFKNNNKFLTYMVVGALVMALFVSCKSNENPKTQEKTFASYAGAWWAPPLKEGTEIYIITINADGSMVFHNSALGGSSDLSIPSSSITKNSDINYTATVTDEGSGETGQLIFTFSSDTQGTFVMISSDGVNTSIPITKK